MTVLGPKVTQTMRQTHLKTTFDINYNPRIATLRIVTAKDSLITDVGIYTTIIASANRAANDSKH